jgi:hypothetical protein
MAEKRGALIVEGEHVADVGSIATDTHKVWKSAGRCPHHMILSAAPTVFPLS